MTRAAQNDRAGRRASRCTALVACAAGALAGASCDTIRAKGVVANPAADTQPIDPFAPVALRLHPLTRFGVDSAGKPTIEARLELVDQWGDGVKALGRVWFGLAPAAGGGIGADAATRAGASGPELRWEVDLTNVQENATEYYDHVTRTYLITLGLGADGPPRGPATLRATFTTLDGRRLSSEINLE